MRQHGRRSHSPRPLRIRHDVWIDGPRIAHVIYPPAEEGLDWCSEVKGNHSRCHGAHTGSLDTCRWCLVGRLRGFGGRGVIGGIASERDSSAETGAGRHRITWEVGESCRRMGGVLEGWRVGGLKLAKAAAWDGHRVSGSDFDQAPDGQEPIRQLDKREKERKQLYRRFSDVRQDAIPECYLAR